MKWKKNNIHLKKHNGIETIIRMWMGTFVMKWMNYNLERVDLATVGIQSVKREKIKRILVDK